MTSISNDSTLCRGGVIPGGWLYRRGGGGVAFGLDIGVIAGALPFITDHFTLSSRFRSGWSAA
jgi:SP family arabinose:H+ symporter-like MFS transporter